MRDRVPQIFTIEPKGQLGENDDGLSRVPTNALKDAIPSKQYKPPGSPLFGLV